jgi:hypothetical protein
VIVGNIGNWKNTVIVARNHESVLHNVGIWEATITSENLKAPMSTKEQNKLKGQLDKGGNRGVQPYIL